MPKPTATAAEMTIDASPTKELFIDMLTRDVALIPSIIDLADNCTDGARRLRGSGNWARLEISITAKPDEFKIVDNCGGMSVEDARRYAFRFGRPSGATTTKGEVGRFGVGMKRGLFKIGRHFHVVSTTSRSQFSVTIDVDKWAQELAWNFEFDKPPIENHTFPLERQGTAITVTKLHSQVREHFTESGFIEELRRELTSKLEASILKGLGVEVNSIGLKAHVRHMIVGKSLTPAMKEFRVKGPTGGNVKVELWCGLGKASSHSTARAESGWYVFCNGRMLLEADKTAATGWGLDDDESIPAYHPQFNDFRGIAYCDASDAADLPWNTTKTALDTDHQVYRRVKQEMIAIARPVIDYFNRRKDENDALRAAGESPKGRLQTLFDESTTQALPQIQPRSVFKVPEPVVPKKATVKMQRIAFERRAKQAEVAKETLGVGTWREVGEEVFDYYYNAECNGS